MKSMRVLMAVAVMAIGAGTACSQSVGPGGVRQDAGPFHQSVGPGGVEQSFEPGGGPSCKATCGGRSYSVQCDRGDKPVCQCDTKPYARCEDK